MLLIIQTFSNGNRMPKLLHSRQILEHGHPRPWRVFLFFFFFCMRLNPCLLLLDRQLSTASTGNPLSRRQNPADGSLQASSSLLRTPHRALLLMCAGRERMTSKPRLTSIPCPWLTTNNELPNPSMVRIWIQLRHGEDRRPDVRARRESVHT